jgi:hypothetical protein
MKHSSSLKRGVLLATLGLLIAMPAAGGISAEQVPEPAAKKKAKVTAKNKGAGNKKAGKVPVSTVRAEEANPRLRLATALRNPPKKPNWFKPPAAAVYAPTYAPAWEKAAGNPYLPPRQPSVPAPVAALVKAQEAPRAPAPTPAGLGAWNTPAPPWNSALPNIPILPGSGQSILPTIKKVYPTGDKPLMVVSFKCPTEMVGVSPPSVSMLHNVVALGMDGINRSNFLPFNMQQVCQ